MDHVSVKRRSEIMRSIRGANTTPELRVRKLIHSLGYRYRLYVKELPGKPDLYFPRLRKAIFIHGCFWHQHDCKRGRLPSTNIEFWRKKLEKNRDRDKRDTDLLINLGVDVLIIWQCEIDESGSLVNKIIDFLGKRK